MYDPRIKLDRLEKEILRYEEQPVEEGLILFYGNSSFTRWGPKYGNRPLEEDIRRKDGSKAAINHGFGTSTTEELLYYYPRLVRPWKPRALVVTEFLNDHYYGYDLPEIMFLFKRLMEYARTDMPGIRLYVTDIRPLASHVGEKQSHFVEHVKSANEELARYCAEHDDCTLVRHAAYAPLFLTPEDAGDYNRIRTDIFVEDKVHYNQAGYDLYRDLFLEALDDIL